MSDIGSYTSTANLSCRERHYAWDASGGFYSGDEWCAARGEVCIVTITGMGGTARPCTYDWDGSNQAHTYKCCKVTNTCTSHATFACYGGDLWWKDSCNVWEEEKTSCGAFSCDNANKRCYECRYNGSNYIHRDGGISTFVWDGLNRGTSFTMILNPYYNDGTPGSGDYWYICKWWN